MQALSDQKILDSWKKNASPWAKAIEEKQIESRRLVTDQAIVDAVCSITAKKVIDLGCGEGWLVRALTSQGFSVTGIDAVQGLVDRAKAHGQGSFKVLEYENICSGTLHEKYDLAVCNFSLLGKESVEHVFSIIPKILNDNGCFIIQTLHPHACCGDLPYLDGWREGSWQGFSEAFVDPAPWYFRTLESWFDLFSGSGLTLDRVAEPVNKKTGKPASLLMIGRLAS